MIYVDLRKVTTFETVTGHWSLSCIACMHVCLLSFFKLKMVSVSPVISIISAENTKHQQLHLWLVIAPAAAAAVMCVWSWWIRSISFLCCARLLYLKDQLWLQLLLTAPPLWLQLFSHVLAQVGGHSLFVLLCHLSRCLQIKLESENETFVGQRWWHQRRTTFQWPGIISHWAIADWLNEFFTDLAK